MSNIKSKKPGEIPRQNMPMLDSETRIQSFAEVAIGYTDEQAQLEASRCLQCKQPKCVDGCPVEINIPKFIREITEQNYTEAITTIKEKNSLPAICGRVCPQESQCEKLCILGKKFEPVAIGRLERYVADRDNRGSEAKLCSAKCFHTGKRVAVIGSGPAGLTVAFDLALLGHEVTVFEALHTPGGVLVYGIPEFRLPKSIVEQEIRQIQELGVEIKTNMVIGQLYTIDELLGSGFDAVFIGTGAGLPYFMDIPGENLNGVYSANEFLTRANLMKAYRFPEYLTPIQVGERVAVIGAGNVAVDAARTARRLGAKECMIVYRRTKSEMPARQEEIEHAEEEGVQLKVLMSPTKILGDAQGWVKGLCCQKYALGEPDESGRCKPMAIPDAFEELQVDTVIMAIGQGPNPLITTTTEGLNLNKYGNIIADEKDGITSKRGVFAGGDIVTGAATVIKAMGAGKNAARSIHAYLMQHQEIER